MAWQVAGEWMNKWISTSQNNFLLYLHFNIPSWWYYLWNTHVGKLWMWEYLQSLNTRIFYFLLYCWLRVFILLLCWAESRDKRAEWPYIVVHRVLKHSFLLAAHKQHPCVINPLALFVPYLSEFIAEINLNCGHESAYIPAGNMANCLLHRQP